MRFTLRLLAIVMLIMSESSPIGAQTPTIKPPKAYVFREIALENKRDSIMDPASQAAIAQGLDWLVKQQQRDGTWMYDGTAKVDTASATAMALLPFLINGKSHLSRDKKYQATVNNGLNALVRLQKPTGDFQTTQTIYGHAIAAQTLTEAYGMTLDAKLKLPAGRAIAFLIQAQGPNGSWGYTAKTNGDTSITGWVIQAFVSAKRAGIQIPAITLKRANAFLDTVSANGGSQYGYASPGGTPTLSAVGLYCRLATDRYPVDSPVIAKGAEALLKTVTPTKAASDMYRWLMVNRILFLASGKTWQQQFGPKQRDVLIEMQVASTNDTIGSWPADQASIGASCGRLGTTCFALTILSQSYRDPMITNDD